VGIISRIFSRSAPAVETRDAGFYALNSLGDAYTHGNHAADSLAAVAACVRLICGSLSTLPASLVIEGDAGREPAPSTASAWHLLARPGPHHSWPALIAWIARELLLRGNAVCWLVVDGRGAISSLIPVPWTWLSPEFINAGGGPRLVYKVWNRHPEAELLGLPDRLLDGDVIHFRGQSDAGIIGQSVLTRARGPVGEGLAIEKLAVANWKNGMRPSALLTTGQVLDDARRKRFDEEFLPKFTGAMNAGKVPLLEGGFGYQSISLNSVDQEFLETRRLNTSQVAMLFGVPEVMLQIGQRLPTDMAPFVTMFAQLALAPLLSVIEAEFDHVVLPAGMHLVIDLDGLQRGSFSAIVAALAALLQSGAVTPNDVRTELNWPPIEGGDKLRNGPAPSWPADGPGSKHLGPSPGATGDGVAEPGSHQNQGAE
jgi:HK97 family phage portal protein